MTRAFAIPGDGHVPLWSARRAAVIVDAGLELMHSQIRLKLLLHRQMKANSSSDWSARFSVTTHPRANSGTVK